MEKSIYIGLILWTLGYILYALASEGWMMFAFTIVAALGGIAMPALQGIMSNAVPPNEQGELRGGLTSLMSLTAIIGPLLMSYSFAYFTDKTNNTYLPEVPFWIGASLVFISLIWIYQALRNKVQD
jgi:DHA1 family tetracycline resistance protein-like MFS transporter